MGCKSVECGYCCATVDAYALVARQLMANADMYDMQAPGYSSSRMLVQVPSPNYRQRGESRVDSRNRRGDLIRVGTRGKQRFLA